MTREKRFAMNVTIAARLLALAALLCLGGCDTLIRHINMSVLTTGPNGPETPQTVGLAYERVKIASGERTLDAYLVRSAAGCRPQIAVLIYHGGKETISEWVGAQRFLYDHCISSMVFDYSGHGDSSRPGTFDNLDRDAVAAYGNFAGQFPGEIRRCVLGHSMGNGVMLETLPEFRPLPACAVAANAFSSLRDLAASRGGVSAMAAFMVDGVWNNVRDVAQVSPVPLMVISSEADVVIPAEMGRRVFAAAGEPKQLVILQGFKHNALYKAPAEGWWDSVLKFLRNP